MKKNFFAAVISAATLSASSVFAVGPDTGGSGTQDYSYMLDSGNSISISRTTNTVKATGTSTDGTYVNPYNTLTTTSMQAKWDYNGTMIGISQSSPYGVDLNYTTGFMNNVGAKITSSETAILASRGIADGFKVFGGVRLNQFKVTHEKPFMGGAANPTLSKAGGWQYTLDTGTSTGFTIGAAYEVPQIYLRASVQYNTEIKHSNVKATETIGGATTTSEGLENHIAPSSTIIKLRSALSPKLLAFANWRSSQYDGLIVAAPEHTAAGLGNIYNPKSGTDLTFGAAFVISDQLTALVGGARGQAKDDGSNADALAPYKGTTTQFIGGSFKINDNFELNASYSLSTLGDANADVIVSPGVAGVAAFTDNKSTRITIGTKISF